MTDVLPAPTPVLPPLRIGRHVIDSPVVLAPMAGITNRAFRRLCRQYGDRGLDADGTTSAAPDGLASSSGRTRRLPRAGIVSSLAESDGLASSSGRTPRLPRAGIVSSLAESDGLASSSGRTRRLPRAGIVSSLYVSEMITSRALVERTPMTMQLIEHDPEENPRSIQLYGVDPTTVGRAVRLLVTEDRADHIDLNFGCPVPKVTRKGGGAALPWKTDLFRGIVHAAVTEAAPYDVPVTVKMRKGIDPDHLTYLEAGRIAEGEGAAAVALHGRTAAQAYSGTADWSAIAALKQAVTSIPVLGNGDIWSAEDALAMVAQTGCDGVVVGRGCLGRPWLFSDLAAAFAGSDHRARPTLREVCTALRLHTVYLAEFHQSEQKACRDIRKHIAWYLKGFRAGSHVRSSLATVTSVDALDDLIATLDLDQPWPGEPAEGQRGRAGSERHVVLPEGWLDSPILDGTAAAAVAQAELSVSGG